MSNILFVFEGPKKEKQVADSIAKYFPDDNLVIHCAYCTTIYNLYNKISQDEDLDTFSLLKEIPSNKETLEPFNRTDFAEVYYFFDYDGHSSAADDEKLSDILDLFNEETEFGKIFINYPMLESLKHYSDSVDFKDVKVKAKENIDYKKLVNRECNKELIDFNKYTKEIWKVLIEIHLKKMNYIVTEDYSLPVDYVLQKDIFSQQLEKYINIDSTIAVLNSFPIFLYEYYGKEFIEELLICET
jgi:hypothetical protein